MHSPHILLQVYYKGVSLRAKQLQVEMGQYETFVSVSVLTMTALAFEANTYMQYVDFLSSSPLK